jgi:aldehyde:ferredoxin oxidoreductase
MEEFLKQDGKLPGYAGKILRLNLTDRSTEIIPTAKYLPRYLGGRILADKLFWDEVKGPVAALSPENKLIYMTGPCCGTGLPISGRAVITGVSAKNIPEQYAHSSIGGYFGAMLKWAGYDGLIIEGRADAHIYVYIKNDKVEFLSADWLWGKYVIDTQQAILEKHGRDACSLVIGPAGEHLHRHASVVTHADNAAAKTGFGAVMGYKNLKAIAVTGTGTIQPGSLEKVLALRMTAGNPTQVPAPLTQPATCAFAFGRGEEPAPAGRCAGAIACNQGCNTPCMATQFNMDDPLEPGQRVAMVGKCVDAVTAIRQYDSHDILGASIHSRRQEKPGAYHWMIPTQTDPDDPLLPTLLERYPGDVMNLSRPGYDYGNTVNWLCNQYGLDKWDVTVWYLSWLSMCKQEGLLDGLDFGEEVDPSDKGFVSRFITNMVYRKGEMGDLFAEGMGRAIRRLGREKYGNSLYHGRFSGVTGQRLDIPVSLESAWGECSHWQGRGFQGCHKYLWVSYSLTDMVGSRDEVCGQHFHNWVEDWLQYKDDPCHSRHLMQETLRSNRLGELKDALAVCEYKSPTPGWPDMEAELYQAATGRTEVSESDLLQAAEVGRLLERAILIRNHGRTRDMEVEEVYPFLTYPDPAGEVVTWDEWNDAVDLYYEEQGWDRQTGWPYRKTWESYGLGDVADELERLGKLPADDGGYVRRKNPFSR